MRAKRRRSAGLAEFASTCISVPPCSLRSRSGARHPPRARPQGGAARGSGWLRSSPDLRCARQPWRRQVGTKEQALRSNQGTSRDALCSTPARQRSWGVVVAGRPSSRHLQDATERNAGQGRTGATRTRAQPPLGGEHGEDGEDRTLTGVSTVAPTEARLRPVRAVCTPSWPRGPGRAAEGLYGPPRGFQDLSRGRSEGSKTASKTFFSLLRV